MEDESRRSEVLGVTQEAREYSEDDPPAVAPPLWGDDERPGFDEMPAVLAQTCQQVRKDSIRAESPWTIGHQNT